MKKLATIILALALIAMLSVASFAAATSDAAGQNPAAQDLSVSFQDYQNAAELYSIDVNWSDTSFSYDAGSQGTWDPSDHTYDGVKDAGWVADDKATVKITNHSNAAITATIDVDAEDGFTVTPDVTTLNLDSAVGTSVDAAPNGTFTISATAGTPTQNNQVVASATITFAKQGNS